MNFKVGMEKHFIRYELKKYSKRTIRTQRYNVKNFINWMSDFYNLSDSQKLRRFHLIKFQEYICLHCDYSASYSNKIFSNVNCFLRFLKNEGELLGELCEVLELAKEPQRLPKVITLEQYDALIRSVDMNSKWGFRDMVILSLFMSSGIRVEEMARLDVRDIDLKERTAKVLGKGNKERLAVYGKDCAELLKVYIKSIRPLLPNRNRLEALLLGRKSNRLGVGSIQAVVKKYADKAGIEMSCHTLRRTFCTELIKAGGNLFHVSRMMGHASVNTLVKYAAVDVSSLQETHDKFHPRG